MYEYVFAIQLKLIKRKKRILKRFKSLRIYSRRISIIFRTFQSFLTFPSRLFKNFL